MQSGDDRVDAAGEEVPPAKAFQVRQLARYRVLEIVWTVLLVGDLVGVQYDLVPAEQVGMDHRVRQEGLGTFESRDIRISNTSFINRRSVESIRCNGTSASIFLATRLINCCLSSTYQYAAMAERPSSRESRRIDVALIAEHSASVRDPRVHAAAVGVMGPVLQEGQRNGEVRTDLPLDELIDFLVEQTYLAAEDVDRSEDAVRKRFRHFVVPALKARDGDGGELISRTREVDNAISAAVEALQNLASHLHGRNGTAS